ncbi:hypothetical protein CBX60_14875 [Salmonella enterica subsp. enterica serovar Pensacola]|nr:hypothetical protein [Salmonella enterica]ECT8865880.1 hypothetical protein [Salmonella enterica subsp. enterica serovar Pensacola]
MSSLMQLLKARKKTNLSGGRRSHNALCTIFLNGMLATVFAVIFPSGQAVAEGSATTSLSIKTIIGQGTCELTRNGALFSGLQVFPVPNDNSLGKIHHLSLGLRCTGSALDLKHIYLKISSPQIYVDPYYYQGLVIGTHRFGYAGSPYESIRDPSTLGPGILLVRDDAYHRGQSLYRPELYLLSEDLYNPSSDASNMDILLMDTRSPENVHIHLGFILVDLKPEFTIGGTNQEIGHAADYGRLDMPGPWQGEVTLDVIYD